MTDTDHKRMLEMAAKAADYQYAKHGGYIVVDGIPGNWNPLTDDGDALRLAVALHIGIRSNGPNHWQNADETIAIWDDHEGVPRQLRQAHDGDPRAATRTAVVRAAAAIGEQMP